MSNHNQSCFSRLTSDSSLIALIFFKRIQYTGCEPDDAVINMPDFGGGKKFVAPCKEDVFSARAFNKNSTVEQIQLTCIGADLNFTNN